MSRRQGTAKKRIIKGDPTFNSILVQMLVNRILKKGKKALAYKLVYNTIKLLHKRTSKNGLLVLERAVKNVMPLMEVKPRRSRGSTFQIPYEVKGNRGVVLALRWILTATRKRRGKTSTIKLTNEMLDALHKTGGAIRRRTEVHRMARANKAFAHFANAHKYQKISKAAKTAKALKAAKAIRAARIEKEKNTSKAVEAAKVAKVADTGKMQKTK